MEAKDRSGQPILDANGKPTFNQVPVGDIDKFMEIAAALSLHVVPACSLPVSYAAGHCGAAAASAIVAADPLQGAYSECGGRARYQIAALSNCELRSGQARGDRLKGDFSN